MSINHIDMDDLSRLPYDLIEKTISKLSVLDVQDLERRLSYEERVLKRDEDFYRGIRDACASRKSVTRYLNNELGDATGILTAMSKYCCYISGSRSAEFFNEGCVNAHSDWDFYVDSHVENIVGMMKALRNVGVIWTGPDEELLENVRGKKQQMTVRRLTLMHLVKMNGMSNFSFKNFEYGSWDERFYPTYEFFNITLENDIFMVEQTHGSDNYIRGSVVSVIDGCIKHHGRTVRVRLTAENRPYRQSITAPFFFTCSCIQSFIGPHSACHMYGKLTSQGLCYGWTKNTKQRVGNVAELVQAEGVIDTSRIPEWQDYTSRGFVFIRPPDGILASSIRTTLDDDSVWLAYQGCVDVSRDALLVHQALSSTMAWHQTAHGTLDIEPPLMRTQGYALQDTDEWFGHHLSLIVEKALENNPCLSPKEQLIVRLQTPYL